MTKALLLLTGGRGIPDMLVMKYLQPDIIMVITTKQGEKDALSFQQFTQQYFHKTIEILPTIDPFDEKEIKAACRSAIGKVANAEWIIHFTGAPKLVGIYAHDIAREHGIPICFLDTEGQRLVPLVKDLPVDSLKLFQASVQEYVGAYGRTYEIPKSNHYRLQAQAWYPIARELVQNSEATQSLLQAIRKDNKKKEDNEEKDNKLLKVADRKAEPMIDMLMKGGLVTIHRRTETEINFELRDEEIFEFLKGDWLEVFVWHEVQKALSADDCQWGYKIVVDQKIAETLPSNELDLALTYKARLLIAECKASAKPFDPKFLDKLYSISNLLGSGYVRQVFITNALIPSDKTRESFESFKKQADVRRICVITGEELSQVGTILSQQIIGIGRSK